MAWPHPAAIRRTGPRGGGPPSQSAPDRAACVDIMNSPAVPPERGTTVSFGVYAEVVQRPEYREAKAAVALDALPDLLLGYSGLPLDAPTVSTRLVAQQALLISNNPYAVAPAAAGGHRPRLDLGTLGVVGVRVNNAAQAAQLALRGAQASALQVLTASTVTVVADADSIPVAVDGEALSLPTPVACCIRPGALRVRVPRHRPGTAATAPPWAGASWSRRLSTGCMARPRDAGDALPGRGPRAPQESRAPPGAGRWLSPRTSKVSSD